MTVELEVGGECDPKVFRRINCFKCGVVQHVVSEDGGS